MSPAPLDKKSNAFSNRVRHHPLLEEHWQTPHQTNPCIWFVRDQLLFSRDATPLGPAIQPLGTSVLAALAANGFGVKPVAPLFAGVKNADKKFEPFLVRLTRTNGHPPPPGSVVKATTLLRNGPLKGREREVTPNHILIPAWNGDACPKGPPSEYTGPIPPVLPVGARPPTSGSSPTITLIDSGYQWPLGWGTNPLDGLLGHTQAGPTLADWPDPTSPSGWKKCPVDVPDANHPTSPIRLDALAGHANFVAGELAQRCYLPTINIWNLNGAFVKSDLSHVPTEAAVLNTLLRSQQAHATRVILLVFAFPPFDAVISSAWDSVFTQLTTIYNKDFVLVAPAGNQGSSGRRYPAAFATVDPNLQKKFQSAANTAYPNVIGVGSLDPTGNKASTFSNVGLYPGTPTALSDPWVTCSAIGEQVPSSFLAVDLPPEEPPPGPHDFKGHNSYATWNGTSFAAPKIAAAIANELGVSATGGGTALAAWQEAQKTHAPPTDPKNGLMFKDI